MKTCWDISLQQLLILFQIVFSDIWGNGPAPLAIFTILSMFWPNSASANSYHVPLKNGLCILAFCCTDSYSSECLKGVFFLFLFVFLWIPPCSQNSRRLSETMHSTFSFISWMVISTFCSTQAFHCIFDQCTFGYIFKECVLLGYIFKACALLCFTCSVVALSMLLWYSVLNKHWPLWG